MQKIKIWDLPVRVFHWTLAAALAFMWFSAKTGGSWMAWHLRVGLLVAALLVFRLCWGIWGSDTARFARFFRPLQLGSYLHGTWDKQAHPGHNPLGALMVAALLAAVFFQVLTGLFAADENTFLYHGYLNGWLENGGETFRRIHVNFFNLLALLAGLHIAAVLFYRLFKKQDLITPMITGLKEWQGNVPSLRFAGIGAFVAALAVAAAAVCLIWLLRR